MLNGEFLNEQAGVLADAAAREAGDDPTTQVRLALRPGRPAAAADGGEVDRGVALIDALASRDGVDADEALRALLPGGAEPERVRVSGLTLD